MGRCGIRIVGRSRELKINYRKTEEIRRFASAVLLQRRAENRSVPGVRVCNTARSFAIATSPNERCARLREPGGREPPSPGTEGRAST